MQTLATLSTFLFLPFLLYAQKTDTIELSIPNGKLYGIVHDMGPETPIVIMIAGSGPTDHNGNSPGYRSNSLKQLSDSLENYGISSLRYDKRGIGNSELSQMSEESLRLDSFVLDVKRWVDWIRYESHFGPITILGHSQGSLVGMLASQQLDTLVNKYISLAGAGENIAAILKTQIAESAPKLSPYADPVLDSLRNGQQVDSVYPLLLNLLRPSIQPFLISWMKYDPGMVIGTLNQKVLIINGSHDIQVSLDQAEILSNAHSDSRYVIIEGMSHILKEAPKERFANIRTYNEPERPIEAKLVKEVKKFVLD